MTLDERLKDSETPDKLLELERLQVGSKRSNLFNSFLNWKTDTQPGPDEELKQLLELLKRLIFKLIVCIESYYLF